MAVPGPGGARPVGQVTRGTTNPNRLRRFDRWICYRASSLLRAPDALVVDLGFGATPATTVELSQRLRANFPGVQVVGVEIDPDRVAQAGAWLARRGLADAGVSFCFGGFEIPVAGRPAVIRACNVLRQYPRSQVEPAWALMAGRLTPGGIVVEGTCDELGRLASWVTLTTGEPGQGWVAESLTLAADLRHLERPSALAARLPKILIHDNVPGQPIHELLVAVDRQWDHAAGLSAFGPRQRWLATVGGLRTAGWPVRDGPRRWGLGELTLDGMAVFGAAERSTGR